jgi:putative heme transporter
MGQHPHLPNAAPEPGPRRAPEPRRGRWWRAALPVVGVVAAVLALRGHLPSPSSTWAALRHASPAWLLAAAALQVLSMAAFGEQQRHLLAAFRVRLPPAASLAVSYARSAIGTALPAGSAVSAGYAFRQFRARGASPPVAAAVMLLSGAASVAGLVLLYAGDALTWTSLPHRVLAGLAAVAAAAGWAAYRRWSGPVAAPARRRLPGPVPAAAGPALLDRLSRTLRQTAESGRAVPARQWLHVVGMAVLNWLTDLACLLAALHAVGLAVPGRSVATAYLAVQLVRQIPVTPGGIGIVEAGLVVALAAAGAAEAPAAAAVLLYRLLSCWAVVPIGLVCWTALRTPPAPPAPGRPPRHPAATRRPHPVGLSPNS